MVHANFYVVVSTPIYKKLWQIKNGLWIAGKQKMLMALRTGVFPFNFPALLTRGTLVSLCFLMYWLPSSYLDSESSNIYAEFKAESAAATRADQLKTEKGILGLGDDDGYQVGALERGGLLKCSSYFKRHFSVTGNDTNSLSVFNTTSGEHFFINLTSSDQSFRLDALCSECHIVPVAAKNAYVDMSAALGLLILAMFSTMFITFTAKFSKSLGSYAAVAMGFVCQQLDEGFALPELEDLEETSALLEDDGADEMAENLENMSRRSNKRPSRAITDKAVKQISLDSAKDAERGLRSFWFFIHMMCAFNIIGAYIRNFPDQDNEVILMNKSDTSNVGSTNKPFCFQAYLALIVFYKPFIFTMWYCVLTALSKDPWNLKGTVTNETLVLIVQGMAMFYILYIGALSFIPVYLLFFPIGIILRLPVFFTDWIFTYLKIEMDLFEARANNQRTGAAWANVNYILQMCIEILHKLRGRLMMFEVLAGLAIGVRLWATLRFIFSGEERQKIYFGKNLASFNISSATESATAGIPAEAWDGLKTVNFAEYYETVSTNLFSAIISNLSGIIEGMRNWDLIFSWPSDLSFPDLAPTYISVGAIFMEQIVNLWTRVVEPRTNSGVEFTPWMFRPRWFVKIFKHLQRKVLQKTVKKKDTDSQDGGEKPIKRESAGRPGERSTADIEMGIRQRPDAQRARKPASIKIQV